MILIKTYILIKKKFWYFNKIKDKINLIKFTINNFVFSYKDGDFATDYYNYWEDYKKSFANLDEQGVAEEKCPHCSGPMFEETMMNEKKDACYYKVKSRYKVWPSAYASGALVKCRKSHGNWGNKSKK